MLSIVRAVLLGCISVCRSRMENALRVAALEQQLAAFEARRVRPKISRFDRVFWIALFRWSPGWRRLLRFVQPATVIHWHRAGYRIFWKWRSRPGRPPVKADLIQMIRGLHAANPSWGARRIVDELDKLGHVVSVATVRKYMVTSIFSGPARSRHTQSWSTFLKNHGTELLAIDFLTQHTAGFQRLYVFIVMHVGSRRILRATVTDHPSLFWVKNQLRDLFAFRNPYRYLVHDNDGIFGQFGPRHRKVFGVRCHLDQWLQLMEVRGIPTPYQAPNANAFVERFNRALREECLNHFIFFGERHLQRVLDEYVDFYNHARPSQGIGRIPHQRDGPANSNSGPTPLDQVAVRPILGGLHHDYHRAV